MTTTTEDNNHSRKLGHATDQIKETMIELGNRVDSLGALIKKHPMLAFGIGIGAGYLIARLVRR